MSMLERIHRIGAAIRGEPRGAHWFWDRVEPVWQLAFEGLTRRQGFLTHVNDDVFRLTYAFGSRYDRRGRREYEPVFHREAAGRLKDGMCVFDVGAHVGLFALAAAKRVGPTGSVYAFEPCPETADILDRHIALNGFQGRVKAVRAIVSDVVGVIPFYVRGHSMAASLGRANVDELSADRSRAPVRRIDVPSITLDQFCIDRGLKPDLLKIDAEGAELHILRGGQNLLQNNGPLILCEVHPLNMRTCGASLPEFRRFLETAGYELRELDAPGHLDIFHGVISRPA